MGNRKKTITALLAVCLLILLCACGAGGESAAPSDPTAAPASTTAPTASPQATTAPKPTDTPKEPEPTPEGTPEPEGPAEPVNEQFETAKLLIGKTTKELFEAIGMPEYSDYAQSCLGTGEDGNLYYDGFTVYTYREGDVETIRIVE